MNKIFVKSNKESGAASIIMTLIILTGMLMVTLTINSIVHSGIIMSRAHINSTKAFFAAESGMERILWHIRQSQTPAFNPVAAGWTNGACVRFVSTNINQCTLDCITGAPHPNQLYDIVGDSRYKMKYAYDGTAIATFTSTGDFEGITKRVVETKYRF